MLTNTAGVPTKSLINGNTDCIPVSSTRQRLQIVNRCILLIADSYCTFSAALGNPRPLHRRTIMKRFAPTPLY